MPGRGSGGAVRGSESGQRAGQSVPGPVIATGAELAANLKYYLIFT